MLMTIQAILMASCFSFLFLTSTLRSCSQPVHRTYRQMVHVHWNTHHPHQSTSHINQYTTNNEPIDTPAVSKSNLGHEYIRNVQSIMSHQSLSYAKDIQSTPEKAQHIHPHINAIKENTSRCQQKCKRKRQKL